MKPKILITSVSRKVWLIKAFQEAGWFVYGDDKDPNAVGLKFCDGVVPENGVVNGLDMVLPTRDAELRIGTHRASDETIDICTDKFKFYKFCKEHGFRTPEVYFVKPRFSQSRGTAPNDQAWEHVWQESIEGEEYSVDAFADFGGRVISVVPRLRLKTVAGESWVTQTVRNESIMEDYLKLSMSLKLIGHSVTQCFWNKEKPIWTDVNCRFGGASALAIKAGCNSPLWLCQLIQGEEVKPKIGNYKVGLKMYRYTNDYFEEI